MKTDAIIHGNLADAAAAIRRAEDAGFDGVVAVEISHDPFLPLTLGAAATERVDLITGIAVAFARNPMNAAVIANDINRLSNGRFILGLGSQIKPHITKRFSMPWSDPAARMREFVLAIRAIWESWNEGTPLAFRGDYYRHTLMTPMFDQGPSECGDPRIFVAAVDRDVIAECMEIAVHAPNGSNQQPYRFIFVDDAETKAKLAAIYRSAMADFIGRPRTDAAEDRVDRTSEAQQRIARSVAYLAENIEKVPVLCVPIVAGRTDGNGSGAHADRTSTLWQAGRWGSVVPALWSFMLALRSRGLGSAWTTLTLIREREVAEVLGIPYDEWMQVGLFPIAHTIGTDFRVTPRKPAEELTRWNQFRSS